jgi:predicted aldo/keto reductase-like oxidoreductase
LALGGYFDALANQLLLEQAMELGITYWETTLRWGGKGYGAYFKRHPANRSKVFLLAKTQGTSPEQMDADLTTALTDIGTPYVDFFIIGSMRDGSLLTHDARRWADSAKAKGKIRYFGFSTHSNMEESLTLASGLGWIDGVMTTYNYRLMHQPRMQRAIEACARQGIALTAIKSQALETNPEAKIGEETPAAARALRQFMDRGQDLFQARLQAVWANPDISSVCSMMTDPSSLKGNAAASWQRGGPSDLSALTTEAKRTAQRYCAGCASVCESTLAQQVPIADVMRYLMYARSYGDRPRARMSFASLPPEVRATLNQHDYSLAEQRCPQHLPISRLMADAQYELEQDVARHGIALPSVPHVTGSCQPVVRPT